MNTVDKPGKGVRVVEQNLSTVDKYVRMVTGLLALGVASRRRVSPMTRTILWSFGAMKLAEGATGWCPMQAVTERLTNQKSSRSSQSSSRNDSRASSRQPNAGGSDDYDIPSYTKMEHQTH
ncbi:hypothetical protein N007_11885 [Alicyclobacillus acidoterrestris ATCC 49025]|nr:hypothetical protein N007_11885 [Alicyclobacillus acidoterrestris ATCC 49025]